MCLDGSPFVAKLARGVALGEVDRARLEGLLSEPIDVAARTDIVIEGEKPTHMRVMISGYACRYKLLPDGRRSIVGLMLPGDICDLPLQIIGAMDHSIATIEACEVARIPSAEIAELLFESPVIARAMWWSTLVEESILRQWLTIRGQMRADRQMIHLFCEIHRRLETVGLSQQDGFPFPLTQEELGDTLGIATVHAHRVLQTLRERNLVATRGRHVRFPDSRLAIEFSGFDPAYLHLDPVDRSAPPRR